MSVTDPLERTARHGTSKFAREWNWRPAHWLAVSHPVHVLFHMQVKALEAVTSHSGYECLLVKQRSWMRLGDFFHQMHHRYFECNYGTLEIPWDRWFGSFHDGTDEADIRIRERCRRLKAQSTD